MKLTLNTPISKLHMVGPSYSLRLKKLNLETIEDLIYHPPHRYHDFSNIKIISKAIPGEVATIKGVVLECKNVYTKSKKIIQTATIKDSSGHIKATWFNQKFIPKTLKAATHVYLAGEIKGTRLRPEMISPEYELEKYSSLPIHTGRLVPIYPETAGLSSKWLRSRIAPLLKIILPKLEEWIPKLILIKENLLPLQAAIASLHFPKNHLQAKQAIKRLAFGEMLLLQLSKQLRKKTWKKKKIAKIIHLKEKKLNDFVSNLPFKLTNAQKRVTKEILSDLSRQTPMNRLLQGDVGSGKTVIAAIAMYAAHISGQKSILMAPTEILVFQHEKTIRKLFYPYGINISVQTGSRKDKLDDPQVLIGTHALLFKSTDICDFGVVVIDEQHRFGVQQRAKLIHRGKAPHTLTMTATPIPRTVALTVYGDLDLSIIDEMPPGRINIKTWIVSPKKRQAAYSWIKKIVKSGEQVFIVCPLIEVSEHDSMIQVRAATDEYERLSKQVFEDIKLGLLHGRMKSKDKDKIINDFRDKKTKILVSTPVVEVGIDIPNASIMMIEGAERFGLAQLHQLRGRVGRSDKQSYCLLFTSSPKGSSFSRLRALESAKTGQILAELDLKLRGPGEIYGIRQHGFAEFKFCSISDFNLIAKTKRVAQQLLEKDADMKKLPSLKSNLKKLAKPIEPN